MLRRTLTAATLADLRARWPSVVVYDLGAVGDAAIAPFDRASFDRWLDGRLRSQSMNAKATVARHLLHPSPAVWGSMLRRRKALAEHVLEAMLQQASGLRAGKSVSIDAMNADTPPAVLQRAGLTPEKGADLLAQRPQIDHVVMVVPDDAGAVAAAFVLAPRAADALVLRTAAEKRSGYAEACVAAALGATVWARGEEPAALFDRLVALPALVIASEILKPNGVS